MHPIIRNTAYIILFLAAICADIKLQKCYNCELTSKPKHLSVCYWTLSNVVAIFGFATQVFIPFKVVFQNLSNTALTLLWIYCVVGNLGFRIIVYYYRQYLHTITGPWAFFNDANSWIIVPLILGYYIVKNKDTMILHAENSRATRIKKYLLVTMCALISIAVDVVEFSTNIDGLAQWWVYAIRIPIVLITTRLVVGMDEDGTLLTQKELVAAVMQYNLLQIALNDLPYVIKNILINTHSWDLNTKNYNALQGAFFFAYAIFFWFINKTTKKLLGTLPKEIDLLKFIFIFYDVYMMAMLVITNNSISYKFFILLGFVVARKLLFTLAEIFDRVPMCLNLAKTSKETLVFDNVLRQLSGYFCYTVGSLCYVFNYYVSGETWLGGKAKIFDDLVTKIIICNIYLASEILIGCVLYVCTKKIEVDMVIVKNKLEVLFNNYMPYVCIVTFSYIIHITFFWEPL